MSLPAAHSSWPPKDLEIPHRDLRIWDAWWGGSPEALSSVYGGQYDPTLPQSQNWTQRRGLVSSLQRFFWGQRTPPGQQRTKLHVPLASEIAQVSADLLFGTPPQIQIADADAGRGTATQDRIDALMGEEVHTALHEGAEACAALGHVYARVGWDLEIDPDRPLLSMVDADAAIPRYAYGRLLDVTLVREFCEPNGDVLRHMEYHERGYVWHALYHGDQRGLGRIIPLSEHPVTEGLASSATIADDRRSGTGIATGIDRLAVVGIANARSVAWRSIQAGRYLGRADIAGVEQDLDALDDVWSSWLRDIRLGRARLHVPQHYLESRGKGKGAIADVDREIYTGVEAMPSEGLDISQTQFAIRYTEHAETARALTERIVAGAGYSPQTFGMDDTNALTATESWARQVRTQNLRNAKIRRWRPALAELTRIMLDIDRVHFRGNGDSSLTPEVHFAETVSESQLAKAQTVNLLRTAEAASTETIVKMLHGDWDDQQVTEEVERIRVERTMVDGLNPDDGLDMEDDGIPDGAISQEQALTFGSLVRSGADPEDAARRVGMNGLKLTGGVPVTLRPPIAVQEAGTEAANPADKAKLAAADKAPEPPPSPFGAPAAKAAKPAPEDDDEDPKRKPPFPPKRK